MKTLEQVFGKGAVKPPPSVPTREMLLSSTAGEFRLFWKFKEGHWFLCSSSTKGWHHEFSDVLTEAAFRQWLKHHPHSHFIITPDNHPPFRNLISPIQRTTTLPPRSDGRRSLNRVHAQARPL